MFKRLFAPLLATMLVAAGLGGTALLAAPAGASDIATVPDFSVCPPVGLDTSGCGIVIVINANGLPTIYDNPDSGPYDGTDDTLVGVQNNSGQSIASLPIAGEDIFGFDGDGLCTFVACDYPNPTTYEGPNTSFTIVDDSDGSVDFTGGLAAGASAYFSLENVVTSSSLFVDVPIQASGVTATTTVGFSGTVANFTYANTSETAAGFSATIDWGDGTDASAGVVSGTAPNFSVSGTHTFASTGAKLVTVTIVRLANPSNEAVAQSAFTVVANCTAGQPCSPTLTVPGVETSQVVTVGGGSVSQSAGNDPSFTCGGDTFLHLPLVVTLTSSISSQLPKLVIATIDKSKVGNNAAARFHICYGGGAAFTDLNGNPVPAGGSGLLPFCVAGKRLNPPPCELPSVKLNGSVVEAFLTPGSDPKYH